MPLTGIPAPMAPATEGAVTPTRPADGRTSARAPIGTPNRPQSSADQVSCPMSKSIVRLAFEASVTKAVPPVSFHTTHESTVPSARSGPRDTPPERSIHSILVAEKYGSSTNPVSPLTRGRWPFSSSSTQRGAVRRSLHTMAGHSGSPLRLSQATTVSRWLVTPMAATACPRPTTSAPTMPSTVSMDPQISLGSCSTHPGRGRCWASRR